MREELLKELGLDEEIGQVYQEGTRLHNPHGQIALVAQRKVLQYLMGRRDKIEKEYKNHGDPELFWVVNELDSIIIGLRQELGEEKS